MPRGGLKLSQAVEGLIRFKAAAGLSPYTIRNYRTSFAKLAAYLDSDPLLADIDRETLLGFFVWLQEEYETEPDGIAPRGRRRLSAKSILNVHTDLSALWAWAVGEGYAAENIVRAIQPPEPQAPVIAAFTQPEVEALLAVCERKRGWAGNPAGQERPSANRDRAIILLLLDTGLRASELCGIRLADVNMGAASIRVLGKGGKERLVYFGKRTAKALWRLLTERINEQAGERDPLFVAGVGVDARPLDRSVLHHLLRRMGDRAGVRGTYPHRFRHTFAINYLRNGGDLLTLQAMLGHSDLAMVRRYARIADSDVAAAQARASPVDRWRL